MRKPIFLDRDGVLNRDITPYLATLGQLELFSYTADALERLHDAGYDLYVISNQQGVALGITEPDELDRITEAIQYPLRQRGFEIRKFYYCVWHDRDKHPWRKPSPGMILAAAEEFGFDPTGAFIIGDKWTDIEAGARAGCRPLLVHTGVTPQEEDGSDWTFPPERVFPTLMEAVDYVLSETPPLLE